MSTILDPIKMWEDLHQIPELGMQEVKTSAYVAKTLKDLGIEVQTGIGGRPVSWALLRVPNPAPL